MAMTRPADRRDPRRPGLLWSRLHFVLRVLGLTGALAACAALILLAPADANALWSAAQQAGADSFTGVVATVTLAGAALAALALLVELLAVMRVVAGRRSAFAFNAAVQGLLAVALFVGLNYWSMGHSLRFDWTRGQHFTLPDDLRQSLAALDRDGATNVVVYLRHKTFGSLSDKPDRFDYAAERKVVEKVKDLVALLREVGPQLRVQVLDVEEEGYDEKLKGLTKDAPALRQAIDAAPENSIFIAGSLPAAGGKPPAEYVQQMSFNELYQLDKVASHADNGGRGNLVLLGQGEEGGGVRPFVRRILNLQQRKPRVGVLVIHPHLSTEGADASLGLTGLRKALSQHGFEVKDVMLKKGWGRAGPQPAADTFEESKLEDLEGQLAGVEFRVQRSTAVRKALAALADDLKPRPGEDATRRLAELSKKYSREFGGAKLTPDLRDEILESVTAQLQRSQEALTRAEEERTRLSRDRDRLDVDRLSEARRMSDVKAKLAYALADCDVLFLPRLTRPAGDDFFIRPDLHRLDAQQVDVLRDCLKAGKPLLACFGPANLDPESQPPGAPPPPGPDGVDDLLADLGVRLGKQTILTDEDSKAFTERLTNPLRVSSVVQAPPLDFFSPVPSGAPWAKKAPPLPDGRLRRGLRVTARSVGQAFQVRVRFPRPVSYEAPEGTTLAYDPVFLLSPEGWKDDEPFASAELRRRERPGQADLKGDRGEIRARGQFPVGVAVEAVVPAKWGEGGTAKTVRVAAVGQGDVFVGTELKPAQERLLVQTVNWLLGRDDALPQDGHPWRYPRLPLTPEAPAHRLWVWGAQLGLPVLFAFVGFVVLLYRRLR
jgi:hypothetical protein